MGKNQRKTQPTNKNQIYNTQIKVARMNGKYSIIGAILGVVGGIVVAFISNRMGKSDAIREVTSQVNSETSNVNIQIDTTDDLIALLNELISKNTELVTENGKLGYNKTDLQKENNELKEEKSVLLEENESLKNQLTQYSGLIDDSADLKNQISSLEDENIFLKNKIKELEGKTGSNLTPISTSELNTDKKVSIFDLDTFQGEAYWFKNTTFPFSDEDDWLIDMYGNVFHTGYIAFHGKDDGIVDAIYNLDNKYSHCNIKIAWPRGAKNLVDSGAYIKFYSDDQLIDISPEIMCGDEPIEFSINLNGVKKFSFDRIATGKQNAWITPTIIYCYFDLIEK